MKRLVADLSLDKAILQVINSKAMARPALKRHTVNYVAGHYGTSRRRACRLVGHHRSVLYYRSRRDPRTALRTRLREFAQVADSLWVSPPAGAVAARGLVGGQEPDLSAVPGGRSAAAQQTVPSSKIVVDRRERYEPKWPNQAWSMDFVADRLVNGTRFRALPIVDVLTREALDIVVAQRLRAEHVVAACNRLVASRGAPVRVFVDNGSKFSGRVFDLWAYHCGVTIDFNRPGKPTGTCFIETFNRSLRDECLNVQRLETIDAATAKIEAWRKEYNESRPRQRLGELTLSEFAVKSWHLSTSGVIGGAET